MTSPVYYVVRQRRGWSVEQDGAVRSGHATRDEAIAYARSHAGQKGEWRLRIQEDFGVWREERSFSPANGTGGQAA